MNLEKMQKIKERLDVFMFILIIIALSLRVLNQFNIVELELVKHFVTHIVYGAGMYLVLNYLLLTGHVLDELEVHNKLTAYRFSWFATLMASIILYAVCRKAELESSTALEIIIWTGLITYFCVYKFMDLELYEHFSSRARSIISILAKMLVAVAFGFIIGFTSPGVESELFNNYFWLYLGINIIIGGSLIYLVISYVIFAKKQEDNNGK
jgi:hypothetical protein